jgi:hypothetical protein
MSTPTDQVDNQSPGPGRHLGPAPGPSPRRRMRWTHALWISIGAFLLWLLLYAPTLQHNAQASPVGTRRTVALDILGPIADVSRGLQLSHIVSIADGIIGHNSGQPGGSSQVVTVGPSAHPIPTVPPRTARHRTTGTAATTTTLPANLVPTATAPLRVLVLGDSLGLDLGDTLVNDLGVTHVVTATLDGKEATGLTRPDYFNWPAELTTDLPRYQPQVVVVMIGANDPQDFPGPPDIPYGTSQWTATYSQRVHDFMALATSAGAKVIWVGMPPMESPGLSSAMRTIDGIDQSEAAAVPGVTYLSSWTLIGTPQGTYTPYLQVNGQEVNVREPDGTHISPGGGQVLSEAVMSLMRTQLHIILPAG